MNHDTLAYVKILLTNIYQCKQAIFASPSIQSITMQNDNAPTLRKTTDFQKGRATEFRQKPTAPELPGSFYRQFRYNINNHLFTLLDIDTRILKPAAQSDPRIHFALSNATPQGARLRIFHYQKLNETLDACTRDYILKEVFLRYSKSEQAFQFWLPQLFYWYMSDFDCTNLADCANWILQYVPFQELKWDEPTILNLRSEPATLLQKLRKGSVDEDVLKLVKWSFVLSPYRTEFWYDLTHFDI